MIQQQMRHRDRIAMDHSIKRNPVMAERLASALDQLYQDFAKERGAELESVPDAVETLDE